MHELSVAEALVREACRAATPAGMGARVQDLRVEIGELSGAVPELLHEVFPMAARGTVLEGARLRIRRCKARFTCRCCGHSFGLSKGVGCPSCGSAEIDLIRGREIRLMAIDVESEERGR